MKEFVRFFSHQDMPLKVKSRECQLGIESSQGKMTVAVEQKCTEGEARAPRMLRRQCDLSFSFFFFN